MDWKDALKLIGGVLMLVAGILFTAIGYAGDYPQLTEKGWMLIVFISALIFGQTPNLVEAVKGIWKRKGIK